MPSGAPPIFSSDCPHAAENKTTPSRNRRPECSALHDFPQLSEETIGPSGTSRHNKAQRASFDVRAANSCVEFPAKAWCDSLRF